MSQVVLEGNCLDVLKDVPDNSMDSIVTDPPYGLSFMGKKWDYDVPSKEIWIECLRVLKPGGHLLAFGGTRTYHRLVVNIEDAGFEIRDQIQWLYGSGFPKSQDVSKAIDKQAGAEREVIGHEDTRSKFDGCERGDTRGKQSDKLKQAPRDLRPITVPTTPEAKQWQGWGTALKPANEPICVARKPLEKGLTVAQNVQKWGTGAINIDESRIEGEPVPCQVSSTGSGFNTFDSSDYPGKRVYQSSGRWPANIILDEEAANSLDEQSGLEASRFFYVAKASKSERNAGLEGMPKQILATSTGQTRPGRPARLGADPHAVQEPVANHHPTVKPVKLMEYLIRLVTPKDGAVLDPFMGSGSTGVAAKRLGFSFLGIEMSKEYAEIATKRIEAA